jgi:hypothetical protein
LLSLIDNVLIQDATWEEVNSKSNGYKEVFKDGLLLKDLTTEQVRENIKK